PVHGALQRWIAAIHRCNAPCTGWETREGYAKTVRDVMHFLEGRDEDLALRLTKEMEEAAADLKFERATVLRDQIQSLNKVRERPGRRNIIVRGGAGGGAHRRVALEARGPPRADAGTAAGGQATVRRDGRGQRRDRAPESPPVPRQPPAARARRAPARARAPGAAQSHRGLRHLEHPGDGAGRLDGRLGKRRYEEGRLQTLPHPQRRRRRRFRLAERGADAALFQGARAGERAARSGLDRRWPRPAERGAQGAGGPRARLHSGGRAREAS